MIRARRWCSTTVLYLAELASDSADVIAWAIAWAVAVAAS